VSLDSHRVELDDCRSTWHGARCETQELTMTAFTNVTGHQVDQQFLLRQLEEHANQTDSSER
jgi:hypothetical protein